MKDLTQYSDSELSLRVFNDEYLYSIRHNSYRLEYMIVLSFNYTSEQWDELQADLAEEEE